MKNLKFVFTLLILLTAIFAYSTESHEHSKDRDIKSEESGDDFTLAENCDIIRHGIRLILKFDSKSKKFNGTVENITQEKLEDVRVEIHLSNGIELNDGKKFDLEPSEKKAITLTATQSNFVGWSAHPEVGNEEHSNSISHEESNEEHDNKDSHEKGEHNEKHN